MADSINSSQEGFDPKDEHLGLSTIAKGGFLILFGSLIAIFVGFMYNFWFARLIGPTEVGLVNLGIAIVSLLSLVAIFSLDRAVVRYVAYYIGVSDPSRELGVIISAVRILVITILCTTIVFLIGSDVIALRIFNKPGLAPILRILSIGLPFIVITRFAMGVAQAYKSMKPIFAIDQVTIPLVRIFALWLFITLFGKTSQATALSYTFAAVLGAIPAVIIARNIYNKRREWQLPIKVSRQIFQFSLLATPAIILNRTNTQTETLLLGILSSSYQVGIYTVGLKATVFISIFLDSISVIFSPFIAEHFAKKDIFGLGRQLQTVTRWAFTLALPVGLVLFIGAPELMALLGPGFMAGVPVLRILVIAQLFYVLLGPGGLMLVMTDFNRLNLIDAVITLGLSVILDIAFIPALGAIGAAIAGAITLVFVSILRLVQINRALGIHPYNNGYIKPIVAAVTTTALLLIVNSLMRDMTPFVRLLVIVITCLSVYPGMITLLRIDDTDKELLRIFFRRLRGNSVST